MLNLRPHQVLAEETAGKDRHFLVIGDYGSDEAPQTAVAQGMTHYARKLALKPDGLFLLGDNFYSQGLDRVDSLRWRTGFEAMYPADVFPGACYAILGNHDYHDNKGGERAQLAYAKRGGTRWTMPHKWYRQEFGDLITLLALDTNLRSLSGTIHPKIKIPQASLSATEEAEQWAWLEAELAKPRGRFTVVAGHHPVYSNGMHGDSKELVEKLAPMLQRHGVHLYLCGHDHDLQHLEFEGQKTSFVISGGGGARIREAKNLERKTPYFNAVYGFSHLQANADRLLLRHLDANGNQIHSLEKKPDFSWKTGV